MLGCDAPARALACGARPAARQRTRSGAGPRAFRSRRGIARRRARERVRPVRRLRLLAGPAGLRPAAPVRHPGRAAADRAGAGAPAGAVRKTATERLLAAAVSLQLGGARAAASATGWASSARPSPATPAIAAMIEHHALLYADLRDPVALLRGAQSRDRARALLALRRRRAASRAGRRARRRYSALMSASQPLVAGEILAAYASRGTAACSMSAAATARSSTAVGARAPEPAADAVRPAGGAPSARARASPTAGLAGAGHRRRRRLPARSAAGGADVDVAGARRPRPRRRRRRAAILRAVRRALPAGGTLLLAEPMAGHAGRRADGRRLLRLLPAGDGARPGADAPTSSARLLRAAGFDQRQAGADPDAVADGIWSSRATA